MRISAIISVFFSFGLLMIIGCSGGGGETPEGLAKEKVKLSGDQLAATYDKKTEQAKAIEARLTAIEEKISKLSPEDKKKFDAAWDKMTKEQPKPEKK